MLRQNIETFLLRKPYAPNSTIVLYHGSNTKSNVIKPCSINVGSRITEIRKSSFWTPDFHFAAMHIIGRYCYEATGKTEYILHPYAGQIFLEQSQLPMITTYLKDKKVYVYQTTQRMLDVGAGHTKEQLEYTIDHDVVPENMVVLRNTEMRKYLIPQTSSQFDRTRENIMQLYTEQPYTFLQKHLFYSLEDMKQKRRELREKNQSE